MQVVLNHNCMSGGSGISVDFRAAGQKPGFAGQAGASALRAGAALALVLAASNLSSAMAQSAPAASPAPSTEDTAAADEPQAARSFADAKDERSVVFVFGRKIDPSIATLPDPDSAVQVVNVISAETLQEQGVTSLEQALRNVPGITTQIGEGGQMNGDQFFIRGFAAKDDIYTDGLRDFGVFTRDSFNYGQVEVLKGPSSTLLGRGTTGGGINTSSKTPNLQDGGSVTAAAGSAEYQRLTGDYNHVLGDGVAVRLNAMVHHQGVEGREVVESDRWGLAPSIGFGLDSAKTSLTVSALIQEDTRVPDYGIPFVAIPSPVPGQPTRVVSVPFTNFGVKSSNFYGYEADTDESKVHTVIARLRHVVNDDITLTSDTKYGHYWRYFRQTVPNACNAACATAFLDNNPATIPLVNIGGPGPYDQTTAGVQNITLASVTTPLFGMRNEALIGTDASWQTNDRDQFNYYPAGDVHTRVPKNAIDPEHAPNPALTSVLNNNRKSTAADMSAFLSDRLWFTPHWSLKLGVRAQWYEFSQDQVTFTTQTTPTVNADVLASTAYATLDSRSNFVSPSLSVIWEPSEASMVYASYATSATPPGITVSNGSTISATSKDLEPEENTSFEIGVRAQIIPEMMLLQAAVFDVKKNNAKLYDVDGVTLLTTSGDSQEAKGVEIGLAGNIIQAWGYNFTYAYTDAKITDSTTATNIGREVVYVPAHSASLWTTYNFDGPLAGLQVGLGANYQDRIYVANAAASFSQVSSHVAFDAMAAYAFDRYRLSLNAYNLADDLYFSQVNSNRVVPSPGRSFVATLGVVF